MHLRCLLSDLRCHRCVVVYTLFFFMATFVLGLSDAPSQCGCENDIPENSVVPIKCPNRAKTILPSVRDGHAAVHDALLHALALPPNLAFLGIAVTNVCQIDL